VRLLNKFKSFIKRIFIDYHKIDCMIEEKSRTYSEAIADANSKKIEQVTDNLKQEFNEKISNIADKISECSQKIDVISNGKDEIKRELQNLNESIQQLKYKKDEKYEKYEIQDINIEQNKKNILLVGFYGAFNLGDELMLETLLEYLDNIENKSITIMLADNPNYNIEKYKDVKFISYPITIYDINHIAEKFDYVIFGGGAIIDDSNYRIDRSYRYDLGAIFIKLAIRAIAFGKKVISIGLSTSNMITNEEFIDNLEFIINNSTYFSVRDEFSKKYILSLLKEKPTKEIYLIEDIVVANKKIKNNIRNSVIDKSKIKNVGIVYISNDNNKEKLINLIDGVRKKYGNAHINLIPFYEYCNCDTNFFESVNNEFDSNNCTIIKYPNNIQETISVFNDNDLIVGLRYHAILLANILNIPCIPVLYDINSQYEFKIEYLNKIFKKDALVKYSTISAEDIENCIANIETNKLNNYELCNLITEDAQCNIEKIIATYIK